MPQELKIVVQQSNHNSRLDQALSTLVDGYSRSEIKQFIQDGLVSVNNKIITKASYKVIIGDEIDITINEQEKLEAKAENIKLDIIYQDDDLIVINKPIGLVVHPGAGVNEGTVMNAMLYHFPDTSTLPRAGIVHRLDKDTSGLMVIALNNVAQKRLIRAISKHEVIREYEAIAEGQITSGGTIDAPIGRDPHNRIKMAVMPDGIGKEAITHYRVMEKFRAHTRLRLRLQTGRTHQIRVHMASIRHPLLGDSVYAGRRIRHLPKASVQLDEALLNYKHQALHAVHIEFTHPISKELMAFNCPIPQDMENMLNLLREDTKVNGEF